MSDFATGGYVPRHASRDWAMPDTSGCYIPLPVSDKQRRARADEILRKVAEHFGGEYALRNNPPS